MTRAIAGFMKLYLLVENINFVQFSVLPAPPFAGRLTVSPDPPIINRTL